MIEPLALLAIIISYVFAKLVGSVMAAFVLVGLVGWAVRRAT